MEPVERLRRLTVDGERHPSAVDGAGALDQRTLALTRIAALVALGGAEPSFGTEVDAAIGNGATVPEIVDVLTGIIPVVGMARAVAAAPRLAAALGFADPFETM